MFKYIAFKFMSNYSDLHEYYKCQNFFLYFVGNTLLHVVVFYCH